MNTFVLSGTACASPSSLSDNDGFTSTIDLRAKANYSKKASGSLPVVGTELNPLVLAPGKMDAIKFLFVRSLNRDPLIAIVTSGVGAIQRIPFDDIFSVGTSSSPVSVLALIGTGVVEYILVGD